MKQYEIDNITRRATVEAHKWHKYWFEHGLHVEVTSHFVEIRYNAWLLGLVWKQDKYQKQLVITAACALLEAKRYEGILL